MEESLVIDEKFSNNWKKICYPSLGLSALLFGIYLIVDDVVVTGLLRLAAFISFSLGLFCFLKIMEGRKRFRLAIDEQALHVAYLKNEKVVREETLPQKEIRAIYKVPLSFRLPLIGYTFTLSNSWIFNIRMKDVEVDGSLFNFAGKALTVDKQSGKQLEDFLKEHKLYSKLQN